MLYFTVEDLGVKECCWWARSQWKRYWVVGSVYRKL